MSDPDPRMITVADLRGVAKLARLDIDAGRLNAFAGELRSILDYVERISEVDVAGVEPMAHPLALQNVLRDDLPTAGLPIDQVLRNAPDTDGRFFKVPKIIGGGDDSAG